jgi:hypothetical protein
MIILQAWDMKVGIRLNWLIVQQNSRICEHGKPFRSIVGGDFFFVPLSCYWLFGK